LRKAGLSDKSPKERVDEIMQKGPALIEAETYINHEKDEFDFIKDYNMKEDKVGRFIPSGFKKDEFIKTYLSRDIKPQQKSYVKAPLINEPAPVRETAIDPSVKAYYEQIKSLRTNKEEALDDNAQLEETNKKVLPAGINNKSTKDNVNDDSNELMKRLSLNNITAEEYFEFFDYLLGEKNLCITLNEEDFITRTDLQEIMEDNDLLVRHITGGNSLDSLMGTICEEGKVNPRYAKFMKKEELDADEEEKLIEEIDENLNSNKNSPLMRLVILKKKIEKDQYFYTSPNQSLEEYIKGLELFPGITATYQPTDKEGVYIIKKKYKYPFKYDLEEVSKSSAKEIKNEMYQRFDRLAEGFDLQSKVFY